VRFRGMVRREKYRWEINSVLKEQGTDSVSFQGGWTVDDPIKIKHVAPEWDSGGEGGRGEIF